jgi:hypothetical protein
MKRTENAMTLGEFIAAMQDGWGFWRASRVQRIGAALAVSFQSPEALALPVTVAYISDSSGSGPGFRYIHRWEVSGGNVPETTEGKLPPSCADKLFGYVSGNLPELRRTPYGFSVGYEQ